MRICFIGPANSSHIVKWCDWFVKQGHTVHVISFQPNEIEGVHAHLIDLKVDAGGRDIGKIKYLFTGSRIRNLIRSISPDTISVHYASSYGIAVALSGIKGYGLSVWGSDVYEFPNRSILHRTLLKFSLRKAGYLMSTSVSMSEECAKYTDRSFEITPFGVDMNLFNPDKRARKDDSFIVGTVKSLDKLYGIDYLIKAVAIIRKEHPEISIVARIAGDGPEKEEYIELARELGVQDVVRFLGRITQKEAATEWANMNVAVIPSVRYESFGVAAVEAQACGTPVIISNVAGLMETTSPGKSSLIVPTQDEKAIADLIVKIFENPTMRREMGVAGRDYVFGKYELNHCFADIEKIIMEHRL